MGHSVVKEGLNAVSKKCTSFAATATTTLATAWRRARDLVEDNRSRSGTKLVLHIPIFADSNATKL